MASVFSAPSVDSLGLELVSAGAGECETFLRLRPDHLQQNGFVHGGVHATVADHTGGAAAATLLAPDELALTAEFKINILRAAKGELLAAARQSSRAARPSASSSPRSSARPTAPAFSSRKHS